MATTRTRVRKPISVAGLIILGVAVAIAAAMVASVGDWLVWQWMYADARWFLLVLNLTIAAGLILPPLAFLLLVGATCRRMRDAWVIGAAHFAALVVAVGAADFVTSPYQALVAAEPAELVIEFGAVALLILVGAPIVGLIAVAVTWLVRTFVWQVVDQDGSRCHRCGYAVAASASATCPECGTAVTDGARIRNRAHRLTHRLGRRWRRWTLGFGAVVIALIGWLAALERPFVRFERTFAEWDGMVQHHQWETWPHLIWAMSRSRAFANEDRNDFIQLLLFRRHTVAPTTLRIVVRTAGADESMTTSAKLALGWYGQCSFVDVPAAVRDEILQEGLTDELVEALLAIAARHHSDDAHSARAEAPWESAIEFRWDELASVRDRDDADPR